MRTFSYRARTTDGAEVRGHFAAESAPAAVRALAAQGRMVVRLEERREFHLPSFLRMHSNITAEERIAFFHELAALLQAGMPVHEALARLAEAAKASSAAYGKLVAELHRSVTRGTALSQAMEMHPQAFAPSVVGMVRAAEESGTLDVILRETAEFLTEGHVMRESLRSALAYPLFLLAAATASLLLMTIFVLPIFAALLRDLRAEVPLPTQLLLTLSDIAAAEPYLIPLSIAVVFAAAAALLRMPKVRFRMDELLLRIPVLGTFICLAEWRMILRTLAILMRSGIRLDRAVSLARSVTQNRALSHRLVQIEQGLLQGRTFAQTTVRDPYLPILVRGMLAAGDAAGDLERLLWQTADYCQRRSAQYAARMEALAEPVMTVFIAAVIFFAVLSFLLPVFDAMDALM